MYLLANFLYSRLNCPRGNSFYMHDHYATWIFRAGASLLFSGSINYHKIIMLVLNRVMYTFFVVGILATFSLN